MKNKIIVAALGLPFSKDRKKILLTQRHAPQYPAWHHKWQLAGGALDFGETLEEAVIREMWEELHVRATIIHPHPIVKTSVWSKETSDEGIDTEVILITYLVDIAGEVVDLKHDPDWETESYGWFTEGEVSKLDYLPATLKIVEEAFQLIDQHAILEVTK